MFRILGIINDKNKLNSTYNLISFLGHFVNIDINLRLPISFCFFSANVTFNLQDPSLQISSFIKQIFPENLLC